MKWLENLTWQKLILIVFLILVGLMLVRPDVGEWAMQNIRDVARLVVEFDVEYVLPTRVSCYDWRNKLVSRYVYKDLKLNTGLKSGDFTRKANGL